MALPSFSTLESSTALPLSPPGRVGVTDGNGAHLSLLQLQSQVRRLRLRRARLGQGVPSQTMPWLRIRGDELEGIISLGR